MEGFFNKKETQSKSRPGGKTLSCASCGLYKDVQSPKMQAYGKGEMGILIIGEAPGQTEDRRGKPWQGKVGRALQQTLALFDVSLFDDCVSINAVNCRPPDNRTPKQYEIDCCRAIRVSDIIEDMKPKVILLLGSAAIQSFIGNRWERDLGGIMKWRGFVIPDRETKAFVVPTFHPSYVERGDSEIRTIWENDLQKVVNAAISEFPSFPEPDINYISDLSILRQFRDVPEISFDYETTGLKPHAKGHRIVCASVAVSKEKVFAFMMPTTKSERQPFIDLLENNTIGKMAHNLKFEDHWSNQRLRVQIDNWVWDSMLAAHLLDNRPYITGLKFQAYVHFGVADYSSEIEPYLKATKDGNAFNRVSELLKKPDGEKKLLKYCALDSHYEYLLAKKQMKELDYDYLPF